MKYKNTKRVDLPEVDFSFHEDNHKVKEMTVQGFPCPPSFPLTSFINFLLVNLAGWLLSIKHASWSRDITSVIPLPYGYLHGKKNPLQVSLPSRYFCSLATRVACTQVLAEQGPPRQGDQSMSFFSCICADKRIISPLHCLKSASS